MTRVRLFAMASAVALLLAACTSPSQGSDESASGATTARSSGVHIGPSEHGDILVGPDGGTLYIFTADVDDSSSCTGECAETWPAVDAAVGVTADLDQSIFSSITREDGIEQLTVKGMPLYYYAADSGPGDTAGQGLNDAWFVVSPSGVKIPSEASSTDDSIIDYGY